MSLLGSLNRKYVEKAWVIPLVYVGLIGIDLFFKWMTWDTMAVAMLPFFIFLGFFVLLQPSVLCAIFFIKSLDQWSIHAGLNDTRAWITKQVPSVIYLILVVPLTITLLPIERYLSLAVIGLVVYWMVEMASIHMDAPPGIFFLRPIYWCIFGYLVLAGVYWSPLGQRMVAESPTLQQFLMRNNPFESSEVQKMNDTALGEIKSEREAKLAACISDGIARAKRYGILTDPRTLERINKSCDQNAGLIEPRKQEIDKWTLMLTSKDPCLRRNLDRINGRIMHTDEVSDVIINGCRQDSRFLYPLEKE